MLLRSISQICTALALLIVMPVTAVQAEENTANRDAQLILHMLDYVSVDYGGSVLYGKVLNETEFQEQLGFAEQAALLMNKLPAHPQQATLISQASDIANKIKEKAPADYVSALAQHLRKAVMETYQVPVTPRRLPEPLPAMAIFQQLCVPCHGTSGHGDGQFSKVLDPKPANFHDDVRMGQRSIYGLYNTISLGVGNTAMRAFSQLSDEDRWALAFLVSNFRKSPEELEQGRMLWEKRNYQGPTPDMTALTTLTGNEIAARYGDQTRLVFAYLRSDPKALQTTPHATLAFAAEQLNAALLRYQEGNQAAAQQLAISAYLEGFEPMEISLDTLDKKLRRNIESEMMAARRLIGSNAPADALAQKTARAKALLKQADERFRDGGLSVTRTFTSSVFVLLRECLEGILVFAVLLAFAAKTHQRKASIYIYVGWISAVVLGILAWMTANWIAEISGIHREIASGITALAASVMLIYLGFWLYGSLFGQVRRTALSEQLNQLLTRQNLWMLALLSFAATFRPAFESTLFYDALWTQLSHSAKPVMWSGLLTAAVILLGIGWGIFQFGLSLPNKTLFISTSILLAIMSIIFAGQGITSLQKAGVISANKFDFISMPMLGIEPTHQTLLAQLAVIGILVLGYLVTARRKPSEPPAPAPTD
jgi:high-affinity iron transporter